MANSQHRCVFVGNIPYDATEEQLIQICEEVGPVVSFRLVIDRETGKPKGYGFCEYKDEETALSARRNLQGYEINGRQLRVDFAENDKSSDRNREQGRGGPGLSSNAGGPAILGDSALHQPIGLPLAITAASVMAGALGDQTGSMSSKQNGLQSQPGWGNDPLTHSLAKMSRSQLYEIMSVLKVMASQNKELARQLLLASPQLPKALFQAQIILGMVTPQVLQMPNLRQASGSQSQPQSLDGKQGQQSALLPPFSGQVPLVQNNMQAGLISRLQEGQVPAPLNIQSSLPFPQVPVQPRFQYPQQSQSQAHGQVLVQPSVPGQSGASRPQPYSGLSVRPQPSALKQQVQPPQLQPSRPIGAVNSGHNSQLLNPNAALQHSSVLSRPSPSLSGFQPGSSMLPGGPEARNRDVERSQATEDGPWASRSNNFSNLPSGLPEQTSMVNNSSEGINRPSKMARLEGGKKVSHGLVNLSTSTVGSMAANQASRSDGVQQSEKQVPQLQLPPDIESVLLQQVMSLTPEQLSSLPPEQQQQVIQLQQMLR